MNYEVVLNDKKVIDLIKLVDLNNNKSYNHGLNHALNVIEIIKKISALLNIDEESKKYLLIACVLHDVGMLDEKEDHAKRSADFAKEYLKNKVSDYWCNKIINSIQSHHDKENLNDLDLFSHILLFADKMDFTKKRLDFEYLKKNEQHMFEEHILDLEFKIEGNDFIITIITDNNYVKEELEAWDYFTKLRVRMKEFSDKINKNLNIYFN